MAIATSEYRPGIGRGLWPSSIPVFVYVDELYYLWYYPILRHLMRAKIASVKMAERCCYDDYNYRNGFN